MKNILIFIGGGIFLLASCNRPVAKFSVKPVKNLQAPAKVQFENQSKRAVDYVWKFGDGDTSHLVNPEHKYLMSGKYIVELTAKKGKKTAKRQKELYIKPPEKCMVVIETPYGDMEVELYDETPKHRDNFIKLAEKGFYDSLLFHRVIKGFMIQGGDPQSRNASPNKNLGSGGPGYQLDAEIRPDLIHVKGALAAARLGDRVNPEKRSSGSQFYIVQGRKLTEEQLRQIEEHKGIKYTDEQKKLYLQLGGTPFLDGEYTVFGRVVSGLDVLDKIASVKTKRADRPVKDVWMKIKVVN